MTRIQLERDPPEIVTSDSSKYRTSSEKVKVMVDVSPTLRESSASSSVIVIVGGVVSKFIYFDAVLFVEVAVFFVEVAEACVAELPAKSLTSAVMVSVPSLSVERSRPLAE